MAGIVEISPQAIRRKCVDMYIDKLVGLGGYEACLINLYNNMADSDIQPSRAYTCTAAMLLLEFIVQGSRKNFILTFVINYVTNIWERLCLYFLKFK